MNRFEGFVICGQFGGPDHDIDDAYFRLKACVERHMRLTLASDIDSVHCALRVDGRFAQYHCAKAERLKLMRKRREAWIDLGVPISAWQGRTSSEVKLYLCECVEVALSLLVARFKKEGLCQDCEKLYEDWANAKAAFLSDSAIHVSHLTRKYDPR